DVVGKFVDLTMVIRSQILGIQIVSLLSQQPSTSPNGPLPALTMPAMYLAFPYQQQLPPGFVGPPAGTPANPDPTSDATWTEAQGGVQGRATLNIGPQDGVGPVNDGMSRGSYLGLAVSQALMAPCQHSPYPTNPPDIAPCTANSLSTTSGG